MRIVVFTGPTISAAEARPILAAEYLPPVAQGDVYRVALERPFAIGIIDGFFERIPAVWHKEILWALSQGIHVFGASSMGALRAAELERFGMVGVGEVFRAIRSGDLSDDDEVAVTHAGQDRDFRASSEAMVNIRASLREAVRLQVIGESTRSSLELCAKELFYPERSYQALTSLAQERGLVSREDAVAIASFLSENSINQKRNDAAELLRELDRLRAVDPSPKRVRFTFQETEAWSEVERTIGWQNRRGEREASGLDEGLSSEELLLDVDAFRSTRRAALLMAIVDSDAVRRGISAEEIAGVEHELISGVAGALGYSGQWRQRNDLTEVGHQAFVRREATIHWLESFYEEEIIQNIDNAARSLGYYERLASRARRKRDILVGHGMDKPTLDDSGLSEDGLFDWYFRTCLGRERPSDLSAFMKWSRFPSRNALQRAALREYLFRKLEAQSAPS